MKKVVKFGGSSLASARQFKKVADIIKSDKSRRYVVPSAPGKRSDKDEKVTDLLYACYDAVAEGRSYKKILEKIKSRYMDIIDGLDLNLNLDHEFDRIEENFLAKAGRDYAASRGEYLNGIVAANFLGFEFVDAAEVIFFDENGNFESEHTNRELSERLEQEDIGLGINNVTIQDAQPPTDAVNNAFKAVEDAKQGMDTKINEARKYQSERLPAANAEADKAARDAEAYRQQRISEAEGQVSRFNDMYQEYAKYPLITKKRMFYETMEDILPGLKVIINGSDGTQTMLPLDSFVSGTQSSTGSPAGSYNSQANQPDQTGRANQAGADSGSQSGSYDQEDLYEGNDQNGGGQ